MRNQTILLLAMAVLLLACGRAAAAYGGGTGISTDPYIIDAVAHMDEICDTPEDWDAHFRLEANINLALVDFSIIGNSDTEFTGVFDGNEHMLFNFTYAVTDVDYVGLFGRVGTGGQIKDLSLKVVDVDAENGDYVGSLVGKSDGDITDCNSAGEVLGGGTVGGLVGNNHGTITDCNFAGSVEGGSGNIGGLVGKSDGDINDCNSTGSVSVESNSNSGSYVGGLVGNNVGGYIEDCYSTCSVTVDAIGFYAIGGLVGYNQKYESDYGVIINCYATGSVTVNDNHYNYSTNNSIGGLVGWNKNGAFPSTIINCHSTGSVSVTGHDTCDKVGGLVGWSDGGSISNCYSTGSVEGDDRVGGLVGKSSGDVNDSYCTGSVDGDDYVGGLVGDGGSIERCYFRGDVDGDCDVGGLAGSATSAERCYSDANVSGTGDRVGGLAGYSFSGAITECFSEGDVDGTGDYVGGLVGRGTAGEDITDCYSHADVDGGDCVGGLVGILEAGYEDSNVTNCYSKGAVSGTSNVGGLVGYADDEDDVVASFWDTTASGQAGSDGGTGLGTALMQDIDTFLDAGWDFVCEEENGRDEVWTIDDGVDYPKLVWYVGCFSCGAENTEWLSVGKPHCWCHLRQCHGDADNTKEGSTKMGFYYVHYNDLTLLLGAWDILEPASPPTPSGPGMNWPDPKICADFAHDVEGSTKTGYYRVHYNDLNIFLSSWDILEPAEEPIPSGPGVDPDCNCEDYCS